MRTMLSKKTILLPLFPSTFSNSSSPFTLEVFVSLFLHSHWLPDQFSFFFPPPFFGEKSFFFSPLIFVYLLLIYQVRT